jgi:thiamine-phosphate pyrophosphorylase
MLDPRILRLVAITDDAEDRRTTLVDRVAAAVRGGATSIQVRLKAATAREVVEITRSVMSRVTVPVIVNDRADIALAAGAAGVHVGEADLPVAAIRRFAPADFIIGASLGSDSELPNAKDAVYVGIGPVYGSDSKSDAGTEIGVEGFKRLAALVPHPAVAVGGITADRALQIIVSGAAGVAVINAIFKADDPERATRAIADAIEGSLLRSR